MRNFVSINIKERGAVPRKLRRELNRSVAEGLREAAEWHHKTNVAKRFTQEHARVARYFRRSRKYVQRKIKEGRGNLPMVYSGRSRARANVAKITGTAKRAKLTYSIPALNFKVGPENRQRTMRQEFEKILSTERREGGRIATRKANRFIRENRSTSTRRLI